MSSPFPTARTAVITGGASPRGIGRATADRLARDGWSVAILDIDGDAAERRGGRGGRHVLGVHVSVSGRTSPTRPRCMRPSRTLEATLPPIIGLANVAGVSSPTDFMDVTPAEWVRVFNVNMRGTFLVTQRVLPAMIAAGVGRIVSVSSISAQRGGGTYSRCRTARPRRPSSASPGHWPGRWAAQHHGELRRPRPDRHRHHGRHPTDERKGADVRRHSLGRVGTGEDVAALLAFLMSEDAGLDHRSHLRHQRRAAHLMTRTRARREPKPSREPNPPPPLEEALAGFPPLRHGPAARDVSEPASPRPAAVIAVLDDDPTGSQSVSRPVGISPLSRTTSTPLAAAPGSTCFILTNTRSLDPAEPPR